MNDTWQSTDLPSPEPFPRKAKDEATEAHIRVPKSTNLKEWFWDEFRK